MKFVFSIDIRRGVQTNKSMSIHIMHIILYFTSSTYNVIKSCFTNSESIFDDLVV